MCRNIALNNYKNIIPVEKAVTERTEKIKLYLSGRVGDHRIFDSGDNRQSVEIEGVCLDDYLKDYNQPIDFIKIDIQGSEYGALKGMNNTISTSPNLKIIIEYQTSMLEKAGTKPHLVIDFLIEHGFDIYTIAEKKLQMKLADVEELRNNDYNGNLFCIKKSD